MSAPYVGRRVRITGLEARPEFNGQEGDAISFDTARQRYNVRLGTGQELSLRPSCLIPIGEAPENSSGPGFGGMPGGIPANLQNMIPLWLQQKLARGERPTLDDLARLLPPGVTPQMIGMAIGAVFLSFFLLGFSRTLIVTGLCVMLIQAGGSSFTRAGGGLKGLKAGARAASNKLSQTVTQYTKYTLKPLHADILLGVLIVGVLFFGVLRGLGGSRAAPQTPRFDSYTPPPPRQSVSLQDAYKLGFEDATAGKEFGASMPKDTTPPPRSYDDFDIPSYSSPPPPPKSQSSFMNLSKIIGLGFLGKRVYDLGGRPWNAQVAIANFQSLPGYQKALMVFMVLRAFGMSPI